jgi:hypothetical protein
MLSKTTLPIVSVPLFRAQMDCCRTQLKFVISPGRNRSHDRGIECNIKLNFNRSRWDRAPAKYQQNPKKKKLKSSSILDQSDKCIRSLASRLICWQDCAQRNSSKNQPQTRQSVKLYLQSSELGLPQPVTRRRVCPPPRFWGEDTLAGERGVGRVPIPARGHTLWYSLYIYVLCGISDCFYS